MPSLLAISAILPLITAVALPEHGLDCISFAKSFPIDKHNATFLNATYYPANSLNVSNTYNDVSFCEIYTSISYGSGNNSLISATWLPDQSYYNDRFMAVGNGGMAGTIDYANMLTQLNSELGLAVAGGDAGHRASENKNGGGEPGVYLPYLHDQEQVTAWIHDAISLFTPTAKALAAAYYGREAKHSFYQGCSTGGAQGMALAQHHPELFDGIIAGCPGNWYSHLALSFLWNAQHTASNASHLSQTKLNLTTNEILDACDLNDGVADRVLENPLSCTFDITTLACDSKTAESDTSKCLTPSELSSFKSIYSGPQDSEANKSLYPGFTSSSEIEWSLQQGSLARDFSVPILQNLVFNDLSYDVSTFNWASDVKGLNANAGAYIDAIDPDLSPFSSKGGKLLIYQGWADPFNAATWPIEHLERIRAATANGDDVSEWLNLFMIPGGGHCGAAAHYPQAPATYHAVEKLVRWVEEGEKPREILSDGAPDGSKRTRKLCAWPETARWDGGEEGDVDDWESYVCE